MSKSLILGSGRLNQENWRVYHPNGKHMFTCGEDKVDWYLSRNLAEIVGNNEIKFTFEPNGTGFNNNEVFGLAERQIMCVVDGISNDLQRHHIVPYCYRSHLPLVYKSRNHHDVVLINKDKHEEYERHADEFKDYIADFYGVKTLSDCNSEYVRKLVGNTAKSSEVVSRLKVLFKHYGKIPEESIVNNLSYVADYTGLDLDFLSGLNYIQLYKLFVFLKNEQRAKSERFKNENKLKYDHGYLAVSKLVGDEEIEDFIKLWRTHFIETMKPRFMPTGWDIDFRCKQNI